MYGKYTFAVLEIVRSAAFVTAAIVAMLYLASQQFSMSYSTYLFQYYFNAPGLTLLPTVFQYLPVAAMMFFATKLGNRFGRREICAWGVLAAGLGNLILYLLHTKSVWLYIAVLLISGIGTTFIKSIILFKFC